MQEIFDINALNFETACHILIYPLGKYRFYTGSDTNAVEIRMSILP